MSDMDKKFPVILSSLLLAAVFGLSTMAKSCVSVGKDGAKADVVVKVNDGHGGEVIASGADVTRNVNVGRFSSLDVSSAIKVNYAVGSNVSVSVTAPENVMPYVVVKVDGDELECYLKHKSFNLKNRQIVVNITAPMVKEIEASGASSVNVLSDVSGMASIEADASGASNVNFKSLSADKVEFDVSGASSIIATTVKAKLADLEASGASNITIAGTASSVGASASGASNIDISGLTVSGGSLSASGASNIKANGSARACKQTTSGMSKISF